MRTRLVVATALCLLILSPGVQAQTPALEVEDSGGATLFQVNTDGTLLLPQGAASGFVLTSDASGNTSWQAGPGLVLPFSGTYNQVQPAFSLTKNGSGELLSLSKTGPGQALFVTAGGGSVGDFAARINGSFGGITTQAGDGFGLNVTNNSASATVRAANSGSGVAGRFEGDVEITGGLACTGCIDGTDVAINSIEGIRIQDGTLSGADVADGSLTPLDVNAGSGFYVSKSQVYIEEVTDTIPANGTRQTEATCRDASDLPLTGECDGGGIGPIFLSAFRTLSWTSTSAAAGYQCVFRSQSASVGNVSVRIACLDVN